MKKTHFPGYSKCVSCESIISENDIRSHLLNCRSKSSMNNKSCPTCNKQFPSKDFDQHIEICNQQENISSLVNKKCPFCETFVENLSLHCQTCANNCDNDNNGYATPRAQTPNQNEKKQTKLCVFCSQNFDEEHFAEHIATCFNDKPLANTDNQDFSNEKIDQNPVMLRKECPLCSQQINQYQYEEHFNSCSTDSLNQVQPTKQCPLCHDKFDQSLFANHLQSCSNTDQSLTDITSSQRKKQKKECILCFQSVNADEYVDHVGSCPSTNNSHHNDENQCAASASGNTKTTKDCILCFKPIDLSQYENHVLACLTQTENQSHYSTVTKNLKCLTCNRSLNKEHDMYKEMSCHSRHIHCLPCLQRSMEEFARNRETPVCHKTLCDYELSRHDISLIPLERRLSDRLLKLVKGQQRPLCLKCHFYIDINDNETFDDHVESCDDHIPCEYCHLPFVFQQLENHAIQCRSDKTSKNEKLTNFVLKRTKYPFTKEQIRFFIEQQIKMNARMSLDPFAIITALAEFGATFPYEMPTRVCDVCVESRPYDDIYVFDCPDSHKLCYQCYYQSCQAKMANGEILTCPLCTNPLPLRDGELNQLRVPIDELKKIREYQIKKTFDAYSSRTRGVLKCPKQNCTWAAEAEDPNERFKVNCDLCKHEFCSLCNQQYHYRTTCQQLPQITQRWFFWCQTERTRYLTMRAQQDTTFAAQLNEYNRKTSDNDNRNRELRRCYDNLITDEQYKAQNCRLCPSCKRVVQRLEGCDSMICGQDAHGGNLQSGCKTKFNWAQAQPYTAAATQQPKQTIVDLPKPENPVVHHNGVKCDQCQNDVNGIRFDCVHCPALTFCEKCEQQATLNHSRENQFIGHQQHVFKLIMTPEEEANYL